MAMALCACVENVGGGGRGSLWLFEFLILDRA